MLGTVLPLALVVGLSPLPIMPAVLLLMTPRGSRNGIAYLAAWAVVLTAVVAAAAVLGTLIDPGAATDDGIGWVQVVTGVVFLAMAAVKWLRRPKPGRPKPTPGWMAALDGYSPQQSARLGALLAANPKNLAMALAAGGEIAVLAGGPGAAAAAVLAFTAVGSLGVAAPVLAHAILVERAATPLERGKGWLDRNSTALTVGVLAVLGVLLLAKGLPAAT